MNKVLFLSTLASVSLAAGVASAVTLTNLDKADATVKADIAGQVETVTLKENASFDSKGKDASFVIGNEAPVAAKGGDHLVIKGGKIEAAKTVKLETVKPETAAPSAGKPATDAPLAKEEAKK